MIETNEKLISSSGVYLLTWRGILSSLPSLSAHIEKRGL